jgi:hypothetical protein
MAAKWFLALPPKVQGHPAIQALRDLEEPELLGLTLAMAEQALTAE